MRHTGTALTFACVMQVLQGLHQAQQAQGAAPTQEGGQGAGAIEALSDALSVHYGCGLEVTQFDQHALTSGTNAQALACMEVQVNGVVLHGVAQAEDTTAVALQAMLTAFSHSEAAELGAIRSKSYA